MIVIVSFLLFLLSIVLILLLIFDLYPDVKKKKNNKCPSGCEKPPSIHGNCKLNETTCDAECPYVCADPFGDCKYDSACAECGTITMVSNECKKPYEYGQRM
tara:strand:- start:871 stop:1176 length:306 start_codon:yes stop_codon:yes gene_type:complete